MPLKHVRLSHTGIVSKWLTLSLNFFDQLVAPLFYFLTPWADTQLQGEPHQRENEIHGGGKNLQNLTEIAVYLGNGMR